MKRMRLLVLLICAVVLGACAAEESDTLVLDLVSSKQENEEVVKSSEPVYRYEDQLVSKQFTDEASGNLYASYSYRVPMMRIANAEDLTDDALATAQRNMESFNAYMQEVLDEAVAFGEEFAWELEGGEFAMNSTTPAADEKGMTVSQTGQIVTVRGDGYFYGGGAHPYTYTDSYTFDLSVGQFIDPAQIGDDPEAFRLKAAALLVVRAEGLGEDYTAGYWDDYAEIISHWNEAAVLFDDAGMTVIFSAYELGPYAMGPVELFLTYDELADAIGEGGLAHLGVVSDS